MKKAYAIPIIIICIIMAVYFVMNSLALSSYDGDSFSKSLTNSKRENLFISYYESSVDSFLLNGKKVKTPRAWSEWGWKTKSGLFSSEKEIIKNEMNFIIEDTIVCSGSSRYIYWIINSGQGLNCLTSVGFGSRINKVSKQVKLLVKWPSKDLGWKKEVVSDTIIYNAPSDFLK